MVTQVGWDGEKHTIWPWDLAAQASFKPIFPSPSWQERESRSQELDRRPVTLFLQAVVNGLQMGFLYALVAVGLTIIWGLMEMINFAHGEFLMLGMFGAWGLSVALGWDPLVSIVPIAARHVRGGRARLSPAHAARAARRLFTQIFATIGLLFFIQNAVVALFTSDYRFVSNSLPHAARAAPTSRPRRHASGCRSSSAGSSRWLLFLALYLLIDRTEFGLALQATAEDRDAAMLVGIRPQRMFAVAWGLGAALVAVAGVILANFFAVYPAGRALRSPCSPTPSSPSAASAASSGRCSPRSWSA